MRSARMPLVIALCMVMVFALVPMATASATTILATGTDGDVVQESDLEGCMTLAWPDGERFVGTFTAQGSVAGPGIKVGTFRDSIPLDLSDPADGQDGEITLDDEVCISGAYAPADRGQATYTLAGRIVSGNEGEFVLTEVCTVVHHHVSCM